MTHVLYLDVDWSEGALQRLIGLVERRGFTIQALEVAEAGIRRSVELTVAPRDEHRCVEVLGRQIDRLLCVRRRGGEGQTGGLYGHAFPLVG